MTLQIVKGDLFDPAFKFDALAQGVNCRGIMGAGIAVPFKERFPKMYREYEELCRKYSKILPGYTQHSQSDWLSTSSLDADHEVFNLFTQYNPGANAQYDHLEKSVFHMLMIVESFGSSYKIGMPWIGCGIGGLEKHNVYHLLKEYLEFSKTEFYIVEQ